MGGQSVCRREASPGPGISSSRVGSREGAIKMILLHFLRSLIHHIKHGQSIMKFKKLVPEIYYADIKAGLKIFVECLEFSIGHSELNSAQPFCVLDKDGLSIMLFENKEYAKK